MKFLTFATAALATLTVVNGMAIKLQPQEIGNRVEIKDVNIVERDLLTDASTDTLGPLFKALAEVFAVFSSAAEHPNAAGLADGGGSNADTAMDAGEVLQMLPAHQPE